MPTLAENVSERLVIKAHSTGTYDPTSEPVPASDPGATGGQIWRYVDHNLSLTRDAYTPDEIRIDQQQPIDKLGTRRVPATINALLSPASHELAIEAVLRGTWSAAAVELDEGDLTSVAASASGKTLTFGGGDPVALGLRVGMLARLAGASETANNGINFTILGFSGASNRVMEVYPAPTDMTADTEFDLVSVGRYVSAPASSLVRRKFAIETCNSDSDIAKLYTEILFGGLSFNAAPNQDIRMGFTGMGRGRTVYSEGDAPFFTAPTAAPTSDVISSMDGLLRLNGSTIGYMTALEFSFASQLAAPAQINADGLAAGVVAQGNRVLSGSFTLFELDTTFHTLYDAETEFSILAHCPENDDADADAVNIFLPRVKITNQQVVVIDGAKALQCNFSGGRYLGSGAGIESTSIFIHDTLVS